MTAFQCPRIIAHRGASYYAPENTQAAIELAAEQGAKWIEVDLWLTADDNIAIIHNSTVNKRTNGRGRVSEKNYSDLSQLDAGSWYSKKYAGERILSLEKLIALVTKLKMNVNLEIKANSKKNQRTAEVVGEIVLKYWPKAKPLPLVSSFAIETLEVMHKLHPSIPRGLLVNEWNTQLHQKATELACKTINASRRIISQRNLIQMKETGCDVLVYTVNSLKNAVKLIEMGVDGIFTDRPDKIIETLQQRGLYSM